MRIVIEIDGGELDAAAVHPSAVTITFPQAPAAEGAAGIRQVVAGEVVEPGPAAEDAGSAPVGGLPWGEPPAFVSPTFPAAAETEAEATDAGPAPREGPSAYEPFVFVPTVEPAAVGAVAEAIDAGRAPTVGLSSDESVAPIPPTIPYAPVAEASAEDAGPAPEARILREVTGLGVAPGPPALADDGGADAAMIVEGTAGARAAERGPDDLTAIDGIGPKISAVLLESGITSFGELAACDLDTLKQLLVDASIAANVDTWPEQARVAATRDLAALDALQTRLRIRR